MKKIFGDVKISEEEIADIVLNDIIKREIVNSDEAKKAAKDIEKAVRKLERAKEKNAQSARANDISAPDSEEGPDIPDQKDAPEENEQD
jgi:predicted secreted Zn-dependent protease